MQITHLGHSCLLLEVSGQRLLVDPGNFSDVEGVRGLSAVLVTHQHADHADPEVLPGLLDANPGAVLHAGPRTLEALAEAVGEAPVRELVSGEELAFGAVTVSVVGELHAVNHPYVPRVENLGLVVRADGEPTVFHPGDALDAEPGEVDLLCVPVNAPWGKVAEAIEFVRRVRPRRAVVPIHDGLLNDDGRAMYLKHIGDFGLDGGIQILDLRGRGAVEVSA